MKRLFQIAVMVLFPLWGTGQSYFNELVFGDVVLTMGQILVTDSGYIGLGSGFNPVVRSYSIYYFDQNGQVEKTHLHGEEPTMFYAGNLIQVDNGLVHIGTIVDSAINSGPSDPYLSFFDSDGNNTLNKRLFGPEGGEGVGDATVLENGNIVFTGGSTGFGDSSGDFYITIVDNKGDLVWQQNYGDPGLTETCVSFLPTDDKGFLLFGHKEVTEGNWDIWIVKIDSVGKMEWDTLIGTEFDDFGGLSSYAPDGNVVLAYESRLGPDIMFPSVITLSKINAENGQVIFTKTYPEFEDGGVFAEPVVNSDGTIVYAGHYRPGGIRPNGIVFKTNPKGELLWSREYYTRMDIDEYIYDIKPTPDSGYVFCGSAFDEEKEQRGWIVKLDCHGNDSITYYEPDSACVVYSNITYYQSPINEDIKLFPNPATDHLTVEFPEGLAVEAIELINATGQILFREVLPASGQQPATHHKLQTSNFSPGLYWLKVRSKGGITYARKLVLR